MDNRKNPRTSVLDDFRSLSSTDQDIVLEVITQLRRTPKATAPAAKPRQRRSAPPTQTAVIVDDKEPVPVIDE